MLLAVNAFALNISKNTIVNIGKNTQLKLTSLDLQNGGTLFGDTASLLIISTTKEQKIEGQDFYLSSLKIAGDVFCGVPLLTLNGDLNLQSGVFNINTNQIIIYGDLIGEHEKAYVTASSGTIESAIRYLPAGRQTNVLGLDFTPLNEVYDAKVSRSHNPVMRSTVSGNYSSANRVYQFSMPMNLTDVGYTALVHEAAHIEKQTLFIENFNGWEKVMLPNSDFLSVTRVSAFAPDELYFPKIITPNQATNSTFKITGIEEYPNARLVIFSKEGKILYDICPYKNDFDGRNLQNGTYYYLFSEQYDSSPIKKSFFEIVK